MNNSPVWVYKKVKGVVESLLTTEDVAVDMYEDGWCDSPAKCKNVKADKNKKPIKESIKDKPSE